MPDKDLFAVRISLLQGFLHANNCDGVLLNRTANFAMATGGKRNYVSTGTGTGACSLFVTAKGDAYFVGNNIEAARVMDEELACLGCGVKKHLWFHGDGARLVAKEFPGNLASDDGTVGPNVHAALAGLRATLTEAELEKYRRLGARASTAMSAVIDAIEPGMTESGIAARLHAEAANQDCRLPVCLVAADERIARYRHPLPTETPLLADGLQEKRVEGYVMVAGGFCKEGLTVSMTRFRQVGDVRARVHGAFRHICAVDAILQESTQPGKTLGDVFAACQQAYIDLKFPENEWHNHHQGGATGYESRTCKGAPGVTFPVLDPQHAKWAREFYGHDVPLGAAFAWNPSAKGVKSEDTFILLPNGDTEVVTATPQYPQVDLPGVLGRETSVAKTAIVE